jgi:hypothetical protein
MAQFTIPLPQARVKAAASMPIDAKVTSGLLANHIDHFHVFRTKGINKARQFRISNA